MIKQQLSKEQIKPLGNQLLIQLQDIPITRETKQGILLVNQPSEKHAHVVAVGSKCELGIAVGDEVLFKASAVGTELAPGLLLMAESQLCCVIIPIAGAIKQ